MHTASLLVEAEVTRHGEIVVVTASVPVGIGAEMKLRFRKWTYRCRDRGGRMEFLGYVRD